MKKKIFIPIIIALASQMIVSGCGDTKVSEKQTSQNLSTPTQTIDVSQDIIENTVEQDSKEIEKKIIQANYENCFEKINGCIVIYDEMQNEYVVYNEDLGGQEASPCSSFKVISGLIGLEEGVLTSSDSRMNYNGSKYPIDLWNEDLTLKEAFQCSCVWYFKKVMDQVGSEKVTQYINDLKYGNCDLTEWKGSGINPTDDTNGFWLESSLKISPMQQVNVLSNIFEGKADFSTQNIDIMKEIMFTDIINNYNVYGKTGTGNNNAWFVGFFEDDKKIYYFATRLVGDDTQNVSGNIAKEITFNVIQQFNK